ncbi:MAG: ATP-binding protein [Deltaproteobacteria bacterium]|nr:ATP-binding protein [Deltaproteobacteria bacterium]
MRNFIGRESYTKRLQGLWNERKTKLLSIYGRRRVGKTALIKVFSEGKNGWLFEAIEGEETALQVKHFLHQLSLITGENHLRDLGYHDWPPVFELLTQKMAREKSLVLAFDEISWMAAGRSRLIAYIKFYWDKHWKHHPHLILILCGSVASWMVKNVVRSKALYGRISENMLIEPLKPFEVAEFIERRRGRRETLEYLLCFGGIPKYLEEFDFSRSIQINIGETCLQPSGFFVSEAEKIFYNQFKETRIYQAIVKHLLKGPASLKEISERLKIPSGGGLKLYLDNLGAAGIVEKIPELRDFELSRTFRYHLVDEFLRFHAQFIRPHLTEIRNSDQGDRFAKFVRPSWFPFLGYAFERFCFRFRYRIARHLGFEDKILGAGSMVDLTPDGYQYDLIYLRNDGVITLCEAKYLTERPSTKYIKEFEQKLARTRLPKGITVEKVLIVNQEPSEALVESSYFHHILPIGRLLDKA